MHCKKCGELIKENAKFCTKCGNPIVETETKVKKSSKGKMISGIVAGVILIAAAVIAGYFLVPKFLEKSEEPDTQTSSSKTTEKSETDTFDMGEVLEKYQSKIDEVEAKKMALIYLDEDARTDYVNYYFFDYVPKKNAIRLHEGGIEQKYDSYIDLNNTPEEDFIDARKELGFDKLTACADFYGSVQLAYEAMNENIDDSQIYQDFLSGKTTAIGHITFVDEDGNLTYEYGYYNVVGRQLYLTLETGGTADMSYVVNTGTYNYIERTDYGHMGRQTSEWMQFDGCNVVVDDFDLSAYYWESNSDSYDETSEFSYRGRTITMQEYEQKRVELEGG